MLLAAAQQTGLLAQLEAAIQASSDRASSLMGEQESTTAQSLPLVTSLVEQSPGKDEQESTTAQSLPLVTSLVEQSPGKLVATLLFLSAVGMRRTWDLRSYSGDGLGLLVGRKRAYSYSHTERFLSALAKTDAADHLTDALLGWTSQLWSLDPGADCYVDGHHKPVYSQQLTPRGLIGRTHQILGCRGLMLLHDSHGHPLLVLTGRGDWHVMDGLQELVCRYEHITDEPLDRRIVVDREGMGAAFLKKLKEEGRAVVTLLRSNQYQGVESFSDVGTFVPLTVSCHGLLTREVAPARFTLALPEEPGESLEVEVALIRDLRACPLHDFSLEGQTDLVASHQDWQETPPSPASSTAARLIPIITTDPAPLDAVALAQSYIHRWAAQENVIKDDLLPLGLDTNHGFAKTPVVNSEAQKKREACQKHLETFKKWMESAQAKYQQAISSKSKLIERIERDEKQYYLLHDQQNTLNSESIDYDKQQDKIQKKKKILVIQQEKRKIRLQKLSSQITGHQEKSEYYKQKQCDLLQFLENLERNERTMYELDNRKDHIMTVFKVALANLAMWARDHYFPHSYAHATWDRLASFFHLPGLIRSNQHTVSVALRPFNDRQYNRDLHLLCQHVNQKQPHLPDGRLLTFSVLPTACPILNGQTLLIA